MGFLRHTIVDGQTCSVSLLQGRRACSSMSLKPILRTPRSFGILLDTCSIVFLVCV